MNFVGFPKMFNAELRKKESSPVTEQKVSSRFNMPPLSFSDLTTSALIPSGFVKKITEETQKTLALLETSNNQDDHTEQLLHQLHSTKEILVKRFQDTDKSRSEKQLVLTYIDELAKEEFTIRSGEIPTQSVLNRPIGEGKAKKITHNPNRWDSVLCTAMQKSKLKEIQKEIELAQIIQTKLLEGGVNPEEANLAIQFNVLPEEKWIDGKFTVEMPKAKKDLEQMMREDKLSFAECFRIMRQIVNGMKHLHQLEYVQGDLKPDNVLVFKKNQEINVSIADFGKTRSLAGKEALLYSGNPRFCAPEGGLSFKGEVFSVALIIIYLFEAEFLDESRKMLTQPVDTIECDDVGRQGIEKFLVSSTTCPQKEVTNRRNKAIFYVKQGIKSTASPEAERDVHSYIDALIKELSGKYCNNDEHGADIQFLGALLKNMTLSDPEKRPTMQEVAQQIAEFEVKDVSLLLTHSEKNLNENEAQELDHSLPSNLTIEDETLSDPDEIERIEGEKERTESSVELNPTLSDSFTPEESIPTTDMSEENLMPLKVIQEVVVQEVVVEEVVVEEVVENMVESFENNVSHTLINQVSVSTQEASHTDVTVEFKQKISPGNTPIEEVISNTTTIIEEKNVNKEEKHSSPLRSISTLIGRLFYSTMNSITMNIKFLFLSFFRFPVYLSKIFKKIKN
ncbi:MAG: protein kinase [Parachlamydiaceae bacterium]